MFSTTHPFASFAVLHARLTDGVPAAPVLRRRCCYCPVPHPTDGLGPILPGQLVSDGICAIALATIDADLDARETAAAS